MIKKIIISLFLLIIHIFLTYNVYIEGKTFYDNRINKNKHIPKVYDIGFKYIPDLSSYKYLKILVNILPGILQAISLLFFNHNVILTFFELNFYINMIRYIFTSLTILPKMYNCDDSKFTIKNIISGHCYDKHFSGNFASIMILILIAHNMNELPNIYLSYLFLIIYGIMIIAVRFHYTIDIAVAILVSIIVYKFNI